MFTEVLWVIPRSQWLNPLKGDSSSHLVNCGCAAAQATEALEGWPSPVVTAHTQTIVQPSAWSSRVRSVVLTWVSQALQHISFIFWIMPEFLDHDFGIQEDFLQHSLFFRSMKTSCSLMPLCLAPSVPLTLNSFQLGCSYVFLEAQHSVRPWPVPLIPSRRTFSSLLTVLSTLSLPATVGLRIKRTKMDSPASLLMLILLFLVDMELYRKEVKLQRRS